jgi:galactokinase
MRSNPATTASAFAPGRVELLGNHTDYNEGLVLGAAIDRGLTVSGATRSDQILRITSRLMGEAELHLTDLHPLIDARWANYAAGVARELMDAGIRIGGCNAEVDGTLPPRAGLSSSAAFEVATALFLLKLNQSQLPGMELAKLCQRAEHRFVGVRSGLLDQVISIFGRTDHLIFFDTRSEQVRAIAFPSELALIIADSGKDRELSSGEYNLRREQTHEAAHRLGVRALRDVTAPELTVHSGLDPLLSRRARHIVEENERVELALEYLARGDAARFGQLMNESHESSRTNFENSTAELDALVELARDQPGVFGARLTGAGFGGAIVVLCQRKTAEIAAQNLRRLYQAQTGLTAETFLCRIGQGAH